MKIGVPTEVKTAERRVGLTPDSVEEVNERGHEVFIQDNAGAGAGFSNDEYKAAGATILDTAEDVYSSVDLVVKVKEPQASERALLRDDQTLFAYIHLAPDPDQATDLINSGSTVIAYESVVGTRGGLPLLAPMSQVAGRLSVQAGARCLEAPVGGRGVLLGGVPGVAPASVAVIGGGVVGRHATEMAVGLGAHVTVLDRSVEVLETFSQRYGPAVRTQYSNHATVHASVVGADLVIGAVLVPGAKAPHLVTAAMLKEMNPGSVLVDVAIDQGGCCETSKATTHTDPTYVVDDVVHYCVANMPGAVPRTSTQALNNATLPYLLKIVDQGPIDAMRSDAGLRAGLTVYEGKITEPAVAQALNTDYHSPDEVLAA